MHNINVNWVDGDGNETTLLVPWPIEHGHSHSIRFYDGPYDSRTLRRYNPWGREPKLRALLRISIEPGIKSIIANRAGVDWNLVIAADAAEGRRYFERLIPISSRQYNAKNPPRAYIDLLHQCLAMLMQKVRYPLFLAQEDGVRAW